MARPPDRKEERRATLAVAYLMAWWLVAGAAGAVWLAVTRPAPEQIALAGPVTVVAVALISPITLAVLINSGRRRSAFAMASLAAFAGFIVAAAGLALSVAIRP